jgi:hypothetical protein
MAMLRLAEQRCHNTVAELEQRADREQFALEQKHKSELQLQVKVVCHMGFLKL